MVVLCGLLAALGCFAVAASVGVQRRVAAAAPTPVELALGLREAPLVEDAPQASVVYRALEPLLEAGSRAMRRLAPRARIELTRQRIVYANLEASLTVERILSMKAVAAGGGFLLGLLAAPHAIPRVLWAALLGVLVSFVPDVWLDSRARDRQGKIGRALPESLDLLALTVEAGLGLEQAMAVVVENTSGPLTDELSRVLRETELGVPRHDALVNLRDRTDVPELSSFVVSLVQADHMGAPVGEVLKAQAAQVRLRRFQKAKERAAKTPVKILFPMVIGIFPAIFIVTLGPAAIKVAGSLFHAF